MKPHKQNLLPTIIVYILPALASLPVSAAEEKINISADRASYEQDRGIYTGHVLLKQGPLAIHAETLIIQQRNHEVDSVLATGSPAKLMQDDGKIQAQAQTIMYDVASAKVTLLNNALVTQQGSQVSGNRIIYDSKSKTVVAEGGINGGKDRVQMTLQPRSTNESEQSPDSPPESP